MKVVLTLSGGMDSAVLLSKLLADGDSAICLGFDYGQRHRKELDSAAAIAAAAGAPFERVDLRPLAGLFAGSSQTEGGGEVPLGHYADESMKRTVVPNRNMVLLALAGAKAVSVKADAVAYAAHAGDHPIYPDCRPEFADALQLAFSLCDWTPPRLLRPFIGITKADICALGGSLGVPWELTWSCYQGRHLHCGKCGTCVERREAFHLSRIEDPTVYEE